MSCNRLEIKMNMTYFEANFPIDGPMRPCYGLIQRKVTPQRPLAHFPSIHMYSVSGEERVP